MGLWPASLAGAWGFRKTRPNDRKLIVYFTIISILGGLTGMLLSIAGGWAVVRYVFKTPFAAALGPIASIAVVIVGLTVLIGLLAGRDVFKETPVAALRDV